MGSSLSGIERRVSNLVRQILSLHASQRKPLKTECLTQKAVRRPGTPAGILGLMDIAESAPQQACHRPA
jgi:hypothetical protein